jgi:hypothetical protein
MTAIVPTTEHGATFILSAETNDLTHGGCITAMTSLRNDLYDLMDRGAIDSIIICHGAYEGTPENSVAVHASKLRAFIALQDLARQYQQDSILEVSSTGRGVLHFNDTRDSVEIGHYLAIDDTSGHQAWTRVIGTGETFTFA